MIVQIIDLPIHEAEVLGIDAREIRGDLFVARNGTGILEGPSPPLCMSLAFSEISPPSCTRLPVLLHAARTDVPSSSANLAG